MTPGQVTISFGAYLVAVGNMLVGIFRDANYNTSFIGDASDPEVCHSKCWVL